MRRRTLIFSCLFIITVFLSRFPSIATQKGANRPNTTTVATLFNPRLAIQIADNGTFNMGAFPNPATGGAGPNSYDLVYRWPGSPGTSFSTVRIDGSDNVYGSTGTLIEAPNNINPTTNRSKWKIGNIEVTQTLEIVSNSQTGQDDAAKISYTVRNTGTTTSQVGMRAMLDTEINNNDGAPFRVPGAGVLTKEAEFVGSAVPGTFQAFFAVTDSTRVAAGTLKSNGATAPDRVVFARWPLIQNTLYDYTIDSSLDFTGDSAYALYWNPTALAPDASRSYVTFYGLAQLQVDLQPPLALSVSGPVALSVINNQYSPNPFDVVATIFNNGSATALDVQLTLNLPSGLSLASGNATQSVGNLAVGQERQLSWSVLASGQNNATTLSYSVVATASNASPKTLTGQVNIPPLCVAPQITTQPASQIIESGNSVVLSVNASGASPLMYQWFRGVAGVTTTPIPGATASSLNTGALTRDSSFWVKVSNACGNKNSDASRITVVTQPTDTRLIGDMSPNLDTVILTHGLSSQGDLQGVPNSLWIGDRDNEDQRQAGYLIREYLTREDRSGTVNVLQYVWSDAFQVDGFGIPTRDEYIAARRLAQNAGGVLAKKLLEGLGSSYNHKIHFIGHSLGTVVNSYAVSLLLKHAPLLPLAQFTALDRPHHVNKLPASLISAYRGDDFEGTYGFGADFFASQFNGLTQSANLRLWVDNYYTTSGSAGVGDWANSPAGGVLNNAFYNHPELVNPNDVGGKFFEDENTLGFDNDHSGVHQWYRVTILPNLFRDFFGSSVCNGESFNRPVGWDRSLNPCHKGWYWSLFGGNPNAFPGALVAQSSVQLTETPASLTNFQNIHGCELQGGSVPLQGNVICRESSPAFATATISIPSDAKYLSFSYRFINAGDGDFAALSLDDTPIWLVSGTSFFGSDFIESGAIPIRGLTGNRKLTFALYSVGQINAAIEFRNFKSTATNNPPILPVIASQSTEVSKEFSLNTQATDPDGDSLNYELIGAPSGITINSSGILRWTPTQGQIGSYTFKLRVTDNSPSHLFAEQSLVIVVTPPPTNLAITSVATTNPVVTGDNLTYQITITNTGTEAATSVIAIDTLPISTTLISCNATNGGVCGGTANNRAITFALLGAGASANVTLVAKVDCAVADGVTLTNTCTVTADNPDPDPNNNSATNTVTTFNPAPIINCPASFAVGTTSNAAAVTYVLPTATDNCPVTNSVICTPASGTSFPLGTSTIACNVSDSAGRSANCSFTITVNKVGTPTLADPLACTGPGNVVRVTFTLANNAASSQNVMATASLPPQLLALAGRCSSNIGACIVTNVSTVSYQGTLAAGQIATISYEAQVADGTPSGTQLCVSTSASFNNGPPLNVQACTTVNCPPVGPGTPHSATAPVSDQRPGSVLVYNVYTSSAANANLQNTWISLTNAHPVLRTYVHLFFVDGASCSVADSYVCLTPNQTASFLTSDIDPGSTGYVIAIATNASGCPVNFNYLIGDEFVKFSTGHSANLAAESFAAIAGGLPLCDGNSSTAQLNFDGNSYSIAPRVVTLDNIGSRADSNDTLLILNRFGGNLATGASILGPVFGILYDDAESPVSFSFTPGACQFRSVISSNFPRTVPRFEQFIPTGRSGWMKFWTNAASSSDTLNPAILGAAINANNKAGTISGAFNQGHNLHKLTSTNAASLTIPVFPAGC